MTTPYEIPLIAAPQTFTITLAEIQYQLTVKWCGAGPCWVMDVADADGNPLIGSIPLVTGTDLLGQYEYMGIGGRLEVESDVTLTDVPDFETLGVTGHLYFITE